MINVNPFLLERNVNICVAEITGFNNDDVINSLNKDNIVEIKDLNLVEFHEKCVIWVIYI